MQTLADIAKRCGASKRRARFVADNLSLKPRKVSQVCEYNARDAAKIMRGLAKIADRSATRTAKRGGR